MGSKSKDKKYKDDKYIPGTIESQYDNYLSTEEEIHAAEESEKEIEK